MNNIIIKLIALIFLGPSLFGQYTTNSTYQRLGFTLKMSNLYSDRYSRMKPIDIYGGGLYTIAEFHFSRFTIVNSMYATTNSLEAIKGGRKKVKGIFGYTNQAYLDFRLPAP